MGLLLSLTPHAGIRFAEVGFLLMVIAGVWFAAAEIPALRFASQRRIVAGVALAIGGALLIIATHWGHFR